MGDCKNTKVELGRGGFDAARARAKSINVEARIKLIENCKLGPQYRELHRFVALLLSTGKINVDGTIKKASCQSNALGFSGNGGVNDRRITSLR